jgi:alkylhydroperoxidase family enzyme
MAWIAVTDERQVDPKTRLARLYRACLEPEHDEVDNILTVHSLRPDTLDGHLRIYRSTMRTPTGLGLSRREREVMAVVVSAYNGCHY